MITTIIADDHKILREGLRSLLKSEPDIEILGEAEDGRTAVQLAEDLSPDIVIMDVGMPTLNGIDATAQIKAKKPEAKIVALSIHSDQRFVSKMFLAGASAYLLKDCAFDELIKAMRMVTENQTYLSEQIAKNFVRHGLSEMVNLRATKVETLSRREREVLQLLSEGYSAKDMAEILKISVKTVETYRKQVMDKLGIYSVAELTKYAIREGFTVLEK